MKILVTGGGGHVGGAIKARLESDGFEVVSVSRTGNVQADISAPMFAEKMAALLGKCDVIVHCAALTTKSVTDRELSMVNGAGTQEVIRTARLLGATRLIFISSVPVIGLPRQLPIDENHPLNPLTAYHASKLFGEHLIRIASSPSLSTASLRITSPVGPNTPRGRIFSEFVYRARIGEPLVLAGCGLRRQNYVDVRDIAAAVGLCIQVDAEGVFNVAAASSVSNLELASSCIETLRSPSVVTFSGAGDPDENVVWEVSIQHARNALGYNPSCSLTNSITAAARSFESGDV